MLPSTFGHIYFGGTYEPRSFFWGVQRCSPTFIEDTGLVSPEAPGGVGTEGVQVVTLDHPIDSTVDT